MVQYHVINTLGWTALGPLQQEKALQHVVLHQLIDWSVVMARLLAQLKIGASRSG